MLIKIRILEEVSSVAPCCLEPIVESYEQHHGGHDHEHCKVGKGRCWRLVLWCGGQVVIIGEYVGVVDGGCNQVACFVRVRNCWFVNRVAG